MARRVALLALLLAALVLFGPFARLDFLLAARQCRRSQSNTGVLSVPIACAPLPADIRDLAFNADPCDVTPCLPARVSVLSVWQPHAGAIFEPRRGWQKTIEISTAPWSAPSWAVIHAPERVDTVALARFGLTLRDAAPRGLLGLVWIAESRPLEPEDEPHAGFYKPGRFALVLRSPRPFAQPIPWRMPTNRRVGVVERRLVLSALGSGP
jgi:hypothetical protein